MSKRVTVSLWDLLSAIADYEDGNLDCDQECELFGTLVETGMIYRLHGSYGRQAQHLGFDL